MKNGIKIFENEQFGKVRVIDKDGDPWFVAKDIAEILGYSDTEHMTRRLDDDEKGKIKPPVVGDSKHSNDLTVISESGFYNAVIGSQKPEAKAFKKWITSEVLPDIRKHGFYGTDAFIEIATSDPDRMIAMIQSYKFEKEKRRLAEDQRDEAIRTKAFINGKKTATAMQTASTLSKKNEKLQEQIGDSKTYKAVKSIPWLKSFFDLKQHVVYSLIGKQLTKISKKLGYSTQKIANSEFGYVKAYHVDVIDHLRHKLSLDRNMMADYRLFD